MPNFRDNMLEKAERDRKAAEQKRLNYKEKIRGHKLARFYRIVLFILVVVAAAVAYYISWRDRVFTESFIVSSGEVNIVGGTEIRNLSGFLLQYSRDGISLTDSAGAAVWNQTYEMQDPRIAICRDVVAVADYNGSTIYILNTAQKLGEINTNLPIRAFDVSASGLVRAVLEDGNTTWINLYAADGTQISGSRTTMNDSGYPISITVSPNGKLVGVSFFYIAEEQPRTSIAFYNFGPVGENSRNYVSGYNYTGAVAPYLRFMGDDAAFAVSDDRIMFYSGNEKPLSIAENLLDEQVKSVYHSEDYVGLVFYSTSGEALYRLDIYDRKGVRVLSKFFDFEYTEVVFSGDSFIIYNELDLLICNINGTEKYSGLLDKVTALFIPTGQMNRYIAVTSDTVDTLEFR